MGRILKTAGRIGILILGAKLLERVIKKCCKSKDDENTRPTIDWSNSRYIPTQLLVWKKPGVSESEFNDYVNDKLLGYGDLTKYSSCEHCDNSMQLWVGNDVSTFISERVAKSGTSKANLPPQGGGDSIACFSYNLIIDLPDQSCCTPKSAKEYTPLQIPSDIAGETITIAVFDTGLDDTLKSMYTLPVPSCKPGGDKGWNFANNNANTSDDYPSMHGTVVTSFIIEQAIKHRKHKINILPVKIHNQFGKSDLFSVLCGFAYAAKAGVNIINASFGFYGSKDSDAPQILYDFVQEHLTKNNILLIAAAGNVNEEETIGSTSILPVRDLARHPFFPACLSKYLPNVLAITTASDVHNDVSPSQNYSRDFVDICVNCHSIIADDYRFTNPLVPGDNVLGSSYATPIVTGFIAQHWSDLATAFTPVSIDKIELLEILKGLGLISVNTSLVPLIRDGNIAK